MHQVAGGARRRIQRDARQRQVRVTLLNTSRRRGASPGLQEGCQPGRRPPGPAANPVWARQCWHSPRRDPLSGERLSSYGPMGRVRYGHGWEDRRAEPGLGPRSASWSEPPSRWATADLAEGRVPRAAWRLGAPAGRDEGPASSTPITWGGWAGTKNDSCTAQRTGLDRALVMGLQSSTELKPPINTPFDI